MGISVGFIFYRLLGVTDFLTDIPFKLEGHPRICLLISGTHSTGRLR